MAMVKVPLGAPPIPEPEAKKPRLDLVPAHLQEAIQAVNSEDRKSGLFAPTMMLTGHEGEIFSVDFSPDGRNLASGSFDKTIQIWSVYGECENWCSFTGHENAVLEVHWNHDGSRIYSCSADKSMALWDTEEGKRIKKCSGHKAVVNSCSPARRGPQLVVSGADDGTCKIWDMRCRRCVGNFEHQYQILSVTFDDAAERVFAGCLDNSIRIFNVKKGQEEGVLYGHQDAVTGVDVSASGSHLLSNSMDQTVKIWDIQPFLVPGKERLEGSLTGATHNFEKNLLRVRWSGNDKLAAAGSADRYTVLWDMDKRSLKYKLPGHSGSVNQVVFHPKEPIVASASSDRKIFMGELT